MGERYQAYPEYKDSGVEWLKMIPVSWSTSRLKRLVDQNRQITYGIVQAGPNIENGIPYIRPADMTDENGIKSYENLLRTSKDIAADYDRSKIKSGDIVCSIGPSFGKLMITPESLDGANLTQGTARVAISSENVARYYFWGLRSSSSFRQWESGVGGATFRALNLGPLADTQLAFPSKKEQECIANFLDYETSKIDTLIEKQQQLIKLLKEKRKAVISHAVTNGLNPDAPMKDSGVEWLGKVPVHWQPLRFKHVLIEKKKTSNNNLNAGSISFGNVVYKNSETLSDETKNSYQEVLAGEFLINPLNLNFDLISLRTALSTLDVVVSTGYIVLKSNGRLVKKYIRWLLYEFDVAHMKTLGAGVRQTINYSDIGNSFFLEPSNDEQIQIANFLDHETAKIDALIEKAYNAIGLMQERRTALISAAVTGKIDIRNWTPPEQDKTNKENTL